MGEVTSDPKTWPAPNYVDPPNHTTLALGAIIPAVILMNLFWACRLGGRKLKSGLGVDDWLMSVAAVCANAFSIGACLLTKYGIGYHLWDLQESWPIQYAKIELGINAVYAIAIALTKVSICVTYLRIFPSQLDRVFSYIMMAYSAGYALSVPFVMIWVCVPIHKFWDPTVDGHCINLGAMLLATGIINSISDFVIYLWPARVLWQVQIPLKQRIGLIVMFCFGVVICVVAVTRMVYVETYFDSWDPYWTGVPGLILTTYECLLSIICGCIPGTKPMLARIFPRLATTSDHSGDSYNKGGSNSAHTSGNRQSRYMHNGQSIPFDHFPGDGRSGKKDAIGVAVTGGMSHDVSSDEDEERGMHGAEERGYEWAQGNGSYENSESGQRGVGDGAKPKSGYGDDTSEEFMICGNGSGKAY